MLSRYARALLAATFLVPLLIPVSGHTAGTQDRLDQIRDELSDLRSDIAEGEDEATFLKRRIDALNDDLTKLQIEINRLDTQIARIESEVRSAQAGIDRKQALIDDVEADAIEQARSLYKSGSTEMLDALLDSTSISVLNDRIEMLGIAAAQHTDSLIRYHRLRLEIQAEYDELFRKKKELVATRETQAEFEADKSERKSALTAALTELEGEIAHKKHREGALETAALRLTGDIQSAQARQSVAAMGESAQGFIWPLNGPITSYYGERWGRMHTGIDIDGYTGQPIVASKAGKVILSSYYSGYGNAVVVDHGGGFATLYAHMSDYNTSVGAYVEQGQVVGYVGCTGSCTGDHLHFEVRVNGSPQDPMKYLP